MLNRRELLTSGLGSIVILGSSPLPTARERQQGDSHDLAEG